MLHPSAYIQDEIQKIEGYKKIAAIESMDDYKDIKEELEDRYSVIPEAVYNLMNIAYIKSLAKVLLIEEIKENQKEVRFKFQKGFKNVNEINVLEKIGGTITSKEGGEVEVFAERLLSNGKIGDLKISFSNALAYFNSIRRNAPKYYMRFSSNNIKIYSDSSYTVKIAEYNGSVWSYM